MPCVTRTKERQYPAGRIRYAESSSDVPTIILYRVCRNNFWPVFPACCSLSAIENITRPVTHMGRVYDHSISGGIRAASASWAQLRQLLEELLFLRRELLWQHDLHAH